MPINLSQSASVGTRFDTQSSRRELLEDILRRSSHIGTDSVDGSAAAAAPAPSSSRSEARKQPAPSDDHGDGLPWDLLAIPEDERKSSGGSTSLRKSDDDSGSDSETFSVNVPATAKHPKHAHTPAAHHNNSNAARSGAELTPLARSAVMHTMGYDVNAVHPMSTSPSVSGNVAAPPQQERFAVPQDLASRDRDLLRAAQNRSGVISSDTTQEQLLSWLAKARSFRELSTASKGQPKSWESFSIVNYAQKALAKYHSCLTLLRHIEQRQELAKQSTTPDPFADLASRPVLAEFKVCCLTEAASVMITLLAQTVSSVPLLVEAIQTSLSASREMGAQTLLGETLAGSMSSGKFFPSLTATQLSTLFNCGLLRLRPLPGVEDTLFEVVQTALNQTFTALDGTTLTSVVEWIVDRCDGLSVISTDSAASATDAGSGLSSENKHLKLLARFLDHKTPEIRDLAAKHMRQLGDYELVLEQVDALYADHTALAGAAPDAGKSARKLVLRVFSDKLAGASPYFKALFQSDMQEKKEQRIVFQVDNPEACLEVIEYSYSGRNPIFTDDNVVEIMMLAHKFQLPTLRQMAEDSALARWRSMDVQDVCTVDEVADMIDIAEVCDSLNLRRELLVSMYDAFFVPAITTGDGVTAEYICEHFPLIADRMSTDDIFRLLHTSIKGGIRNEQSALFLLDLLGKRGGLATQPYAVIPGPAPTSYATTYGLAEVVKGLCPECYVTDGHLTSCSNFKRAGATSSSTPKPTSSVVTATPWASTMWQRSSNVSAAPTPPPAPGTAGAKPISTETVLSVSQLLGMALTASMDRVVKKIVALDASLLNEGAPTESLLTLAIKLERDTVVDWLVLHAAINPFHPAHASALTSAVALGRGDYVEKLLRARFGSLCSSLSREFIPYLEVECLGRQLTDALNPSVSGSTAAASAGAANAPAANQDSTAPYCAELFEDIIRYELPTSALTVAVMLANPDPEIVAALALDPWASKWLNDSKDQACTPLIAAAALGRTDLCQILLNPRTSKVGPASAQSAGARGDDDKDDGLDAKSTASPTASPRSQNSTVVDDAAAVSRAVSEAAGLFEEVPEVQRCRLLKRVNLRSKPPTLPQVITALHLASFCGHHRVVAKLMKLVDSTGKEADSSAVEGDDTIPSSALGVARNDKVRQAFKKFGVTKAGPACAPDVSEPPPALTIPAAWAGLPIPKTVTAPAANPGVRPGFTLTVSHFHISHRLRGLKRQYCTVCGGKISGLFQAAHGCDNCFAYCHSKCKTVFEMTACSRSNAVNITRRS